MKRPEMTTPNTVEAVPDMPAPTSSVRVSTAITGNPTRPAAARIHAR
ncbi:MAG: hypothetical protein ACRDRO_00705 [Pseudonocardiaceae bacterium]